MATTTTPVGFNAATTPTETAAAKPGFFSRFFAQMIEARTRRAEMHVQPYLAKLSDERLKDLGFTGEHIEKLREKHYTEAVYWS